MALFLVAFGLVWVDTPTHPALVVIAGLIAAVTLLTIVRHPQRLDTDAETWTLIPVIGVCLVVHLLRASSPGGSSSGFSHLLLAPVVWQSLRRRGGGVVAATVGIVAVANVIALVVLPSPVSVAIQARSAVLFGCIAAAIALTVHNLVAQRDDLMSRLADLAINDALTGLPNRRMVDMRLPQDVAFASETSGTLVVAILDLDRFKRYNDTHGHPAGDRLLKTAAVAWQAELDDEHVLARIGGEEFALILPGGDEVAATDVLSRLQQVTPFEQSFSAGFTVVRPAVGALPSVTDVLSAADKALYAAKAAGRNRIVS